MESHKVSMRLVKIGEQLQSEPENAQDVKVNDWKSSGLGLPALEISKAFPQATPATTMFPASVSDYFQLDDLLSNGEKLLRKRVRTVMEAEIAPIIVPYWEKAEFPFAIVPKLAGLNLAGGTIKEYGCPGLSLLECAISYSEIARVDVSCSTFILVHSTLAMLTIEMFGTEQQKNSYLPPLSKLDAIACWALTEPDFGSDASSLSTTARKVEGGWVLNGQKRWIGNCTFADVSVIVARNAETNQISCFLVKKGNPGYHATKIENKISVRIIQNGDIVLKNVFIPEEDHLPGVKSFKDISKILILSRVMVAWQAVGISMGIYDMCHRYLQERKQFDTPLAALQINQEKLVAMLGSIQAMSLLAWRLCKLYEDGKMTSGHASLAKAWNTKRARKVAALGRELLGGNGIVTDFHVAKSFCDVEPIYTYEGSYEINTLITGREITGISSIKPPRAHL